MKTSIPSSICAPTPPSSSPLPPDCLSFLSLFLSFLSFYPLPTLHSSMIIHIKKLKIKSTTAFLFTLLSLSLSLSLSLYLSLSLSLSLAYSQTPHTPLQTNTYTSLNGLLFLFFSRSLATSLPPRRTTLQPPSLPPSLLPSFPLLGRKQ